MSAASVLKDWLRALLGPGDKPVEPAPARPSPQPPPPVPGLAPEPIHFPSGPIKTKGPHGRDLSHISWEAISRWEPLFSEAAAQEGRGKFGPLLLACFAVIESEGQHFTTHRMTGLDTEVLRGHGDPRSRGLLQLRTDLHDPYDTWGAQQPEGNIRLGARLLGDWMDQTGSWEAAMARKWHPGVDKWSQTTQDEYIRTVRDLIKEVKASWPVTTSHPTPPWQPPASGKESQYPVAGMAGVINLPFPLKQRLIPAWQVNQRPGIALFPDRYVQHDTGNRRRGANAAMHAQYLHDGAEGQQLSYHFTIDDTGAYQMLPVNEVAWHGGDSAGPCNMHGLACELCINADIEEPRARENAAILAAELMNALSLSGVPIPHQRCSGKYCPQDLLQDGDWPDWQQRVATLRKERHS